jgi:hypothetical protein
LPAEILIHGSALKTLANLIASLFVRVEVNYENQWHPSPEGELQLVARANSQPARRVHVKPMNIISAELVDPKGNVAVHFGEIIKVEVRTMPEIGGIPHYWIFWREGLVRSYKAKVRVIFGPQVF